MSTSVRAERRGYVPADGGYLTQRGHHATEALATAFPDDHGAGWDPTRGWAANRERVRAVYEYYRGLFNADQSFLWAGLARLAGGAVISGLEAIPSDRNALGETFLQTGRDIFEDLAWQHEVALRAPDRLLELAEMHDEALRPRVSYAAAWTEILGGTRDSVASGNRALLENEQFSIAQPHADALRRNPDCRRGWIGLLLQRASSLTLAIHPYHRDFAVDFPDGDPQDGEQRWAWITRADGMWTAWTRLPAAERSRLVNRDLDAIVRGDFGLPGSGPAPSPPSPGGRSLLARRSRLSREIVRTYRAAVS